MFRKKIPLEERGEETPKFSIKNKADRKILTVVLSIIGVALVLLTLCLLLWFN
ncbi:MAG: hypothetical protein LBR37_03480 [Erysipelotrichaceae bacterium]|nr:hypothetical protein [Erysipelotrichaceae bacterium]